MKAKKELLLCQDIEPNEDEQDLIDFNNQNAYDESDNPYSSSESLRDEDDSQKEIDYNRNSLFDDSDLQEEDKNTSGNITFLHHFFIGKFIVNND